MHNKKVLFKCTKKFNFWVTSHFNCTVSKEAIHYFAQGNQKKVPDKWLFVCFLEQFFSFIIVKRVGKSLQIFFKNVKKLKGGKLNLGIRKSLGKSTWS